MLSCVVRCSPTVRRYHFLALIISNFQCSYSSNFEQHLCGSAYLILFILVHFPGKLTQFFCNIQSERIIQCRNQHHLHESHEPCALTGFPMNAISLTSNMNTITISAVRPKTSILDKSLSKGKGEVSLTCFALLFSEIVQYCQTRSSSIPELQTK